jgi:hypothetical protein|tara:strand:+ start:1003 stop:1191 length:189 start_codon:yes stop_codon:yes gene_type:complete
MKLTLNELEKIVPLLDKRVNELLTIHKKMISSDSSTAQSLESIIEEVDMFRTIKQKLENAIG